MPGVYKHGNLQGIAAAMDERYKQGETYAHNLLWDIDRHAELQGAVAKLVAKHMRPFKNEADQGVMVEVGCGLRPAATRPYLLPKLMETNGPVEDNALRLILSDISVEAQKRVSVEAPAFLREFYGDKILVSSIACPAEEIHERVGENEVDLIVGVETIEHWSDVEAGLTSIYRALKPGGVAVLTTPNRDSLHVRMGRKLGLNVPFCANDHTYEFGYKELDDLLARFKLNKIDEAGVCCAPYWAMEGVIGNHIRHMTDNDPEVIGWMNTIGRSCPEFSFCQAKVFKKD